MGKTIFITGASSGLGRSTALLFASRGWSVIATARTMPNGDHGLGGVPGIALLPLDVTDGEQIDRATEQALARGPVDLVFANAGYALGGPLEGMTDAQLTAQVETNLLGPIRVVRSFLPHFRERGSGGFLLTASPAGHVGMPLLSAYCATKFGLIGWAEALAYELPDEIFVKIIVPGSMKTNFLQASHWASHPAYAAIEARANRLYAALADGAADATPDTVAEAVWDAAADGRGEISCLVTQEARDTVAARETLGARGFRDALLARFNA